MQGGIARGHPDEAPGLMREPSGGRATSRSTRCRAGQNGGKERRPHAEQLARRPAHWCSGDRRLGGPLLMNAENGVCWRMGIISAHGEIGRDGPAGSRPAHWHRAGCQSFIGRAPIAQPTGDGGLRNDIAARNADWPRQDLRRRPATCRARYFRPRLSVRPPSPVTSSQMRPAPEPWRPKLRFSCQDLS